MTASTSSADKSLLKVLESRVLLWIIQAIVALMTLAGGMVVNHVLTRIDEIDHRLQSVEAFKIESSASAFTSKDGLQVWQAIADLKKEMALQQPPAWFVNRVDEIQGSLKEVDSRLRNIENRVAKQ